MPASRSEEYMRRAPRDEVAVRFQRVIREDGRYPLEAYAFLYTALDFTVRDCFGGREEGVMQHVTGQQLCRGLRDCALELWGPLAGLVLHRWSLRCTRDIGEMVFLLVEHSFMGRQESDCLEDFDDVYDFDEAFSDYAIELEDDD